VNILSQFYQSKLPKPFVRYRGNNIWPDKWMDTHHNAARDTASIYFGLTVRQTNILAKTECKHFWVFLKHMISPRLQHWCTKFTLLQTDSVVRGLCHGHAPTHGRFHWHQYQTTLQSGELRAVLAEIPPVISRTQTTNA